MWNEFAGKAHKRRKHLSPSIPVQISSGGGTRGYYYKVSLNLSQSASAAMQSYLGSMNTFSIFVSRGYILCQSSVRIEALGLILLRLEAPPSGKAWPLDPNNPNSNCLTTLPPLG